MGLLLSFIYTLCIHNADPRGLRVNGKEGTHRQTQHRHRQRHTDTHTQRHTETHTQRHRDTYTQTHTQIHIDTDTDRHTETHRKYLKVKVAQLCRLCDSPWNSPDQNTGVGSLSLLQGIFPTQESNPGLPHCRQILYQLSHKGSPFLLDGRYKFYLI